MRSASRKAWMCSSKLILLHEAFDCRPIRPQEHQSNGSGLAIAYALSVHTRDRNDFPGRAGQEHLIRFRYFTDVEKPFDHLQTHLTGQVQNHTASYALHDSGIMTGCEELAVPNDVNVAGNSIGQLIVRSQQDRFVRPSGLGFPACEYLMNQAACFDVRESGTPADS